MCDTLQDNLNAQNYMGKWYQIASIPQFYERGCARAVAEYTLLSDRINVVNYCYNEKWEKLISINGSAVSPNPAHPSALRVSFPNAPSSEMNYPGANYLIHKTDYERYAIVGSPTRSSFYILSREQKICERNYKDCLEYAKSLGYDITKVRPNHDSIEHNH
jgi:apolipoprotein D and lipocalin family protein